MAIDKAGIATLRSSGSAIKSGQLGHMTERARKCPSDMVPALPRRKIQYTTSQVTGVAIPVATAKPTKWVQLLPPNVYVPGGLVGSPCSPRDSQESSPTPHFKSINSLALRFLHSPTLRSIQDHWKNHSLY